MSRIDDAIAAAACVLDSLRALREIQKTGSCNDCKISRSCPHVPSPGQMVRYNCVFYVKKDTEAAHDN